MPSRQLKKKETPQKEKSGNYLSPRGGGWGSREGGAGYNAKSPRRENKRSRMLGERNKKILAGGNSAREKKPLSNKKAQQSQVKKAKKGRSQSKSVYLTRKRERLQRGKRKCGNGELARTSYLSKRKERGRDGEEARLVPDCTEPDSLAWGDPAEGSPCKKKNRLAARGRGINLTS